MRVVLDTHVWLDWLVFEDAGVAPIRDAALAKKLEIYIDAACEAELVEVMARGFAKKTLDATAREDRIAQLRRIARRIDAKAPEPARSLLPRCRDADDQMFLEAALAAGADYLVTKDRELLRLDKHRSRVPFRIVTPMSLRVVLAGG